MPPELFKNVEPQAMCPDGSSNARRKSKSRTAASAGAIKVSTLPTMADAPADVCRHTAMYAPESVPLHDPALPEGCRCQTGHNSSTACARDCVLTPAG